jgi:hypothetical protein
MALNDGVLADVGFIDPVTATVVASVVSQFVSFGPTQEFLERQAYRDAKDEIVAKYKAIMPSLKDWQRAIVSKDLDEFVHRMTRDNMKLNDYKAAMAWFAGREVAWQSMTGPEPSLQLEPGMTAGDLRRRIYEGTYRAAAERGELPLGVTPGTPVPEFVTAPAGVAPVGVVEQTAGFNLPVMLAVGGVLAWLLLGQKK